MARFGADPALLVKLLDAAERLPVHCHPDRRFAERHLGSAHGKTGAWIVLEAAAPDAVVYLGFRSAVDAGTLRRWAAEQDGRAMLAAMNQMTVAPGDCLLVPAAVPHAIGPGVFAIELQEPADLSVALEWEAFGLDGDVHLGLERELDFACLDRSGWDAQRLARLRMRHGVPAAGPAELGCHPARTGVRPLLPSGSDPFFRAERLRPGAAPLTLAASFAVLVVCAGRGSLATESGDRLELREASPC